MFYKSVNEIEEMLDVKNFNELGNWFEFLKMQIDELLSVIKKITKMKKVVYNPEILREIAKLLAQTRNDILDKTGFFKQKICLEHKDNCNEQRAD